MKEKLNDIDFKLATEGQQFIAKAVTSLPDEPVNLLWRSNLNEALRVKAGAAKRRRLFINFLSPVAGLGLACGLAVIMVFHPANVSTPPIVKAQAAPQSSLEASLVQLHQDDLRSADVAGTGLNPTEAASEETAPAISSTDDPEDDFEF